MSIAGFLADKCIATEKVEQFLLRDNEYQGKANQSLKKQSIQQTQLLLGVDDPLSFVRTRRPEPIFNRDAYLTEQQAVQMYQFSVSAQLDKISSDTNDFLSEVYTKIQRVREKYQQKGQKQPSTNIVVNGNAEPPQKSQNLEFRPTQSVYFQDGQNAVQQSTVINWSAIAQQNQGNGSAQQGAAYAQPGAPSTLQTNAYFPPSQQSQQYQQSQAPQAKPQQSQPQPAQDQGGIVQSISNTVSNMGSKLKKTFGI